MIILRQKDFFEYGLTSKDIANYAKKNNVGMKDAYAMLKNQKMGEGVSINSYKVGDTSLQRGSMQGTNKSLTNISSKTGNVVTSETNAAARTAERFKNLSNPGAAAAKNVKNNVGIGQGISNFVRNNWNAGGMGKAKVLGAGAAVLGAGALMAKGVSSMFGNNNNQNQNQQ